jgi:L-lactate dehydrogenase complex protein LldG
MHADTVATFTDALDRLDVGWTRVESAAVSDALADVIVPPAVGAPLPFDGLSLDGGSVALHPTPAQLTAARTGVTAARMGIASYGTVVLQSRADATEAASLFPALHVAVLRASDVVPDMAAAFDRLGPLLREQPTSAILATGPSATADMGALVRGAHGPRSVHVIILDDA